MGKLKYILGFLAIALFTMGARIGDNTVLIGDPSGSDVELKMGAGRLKWDNTTSTMKFSNNSGSFFEDIGSGGAGGAGGVNIIEDSNFDFEQGDPPQDWTASGGVFSAETSAPLFGDQSGSWDASSLAQTLDSVLAQITTGFLGRRCQAEIQYQYSAGSAGDYKLIARQFDDSAASEIDVATVDLEVTGSNSRKAQLFFDCPDDVADDLRIRIEAGVADPGAIVIDNAFIGTGRNDFQLSQAVHVGTWFMDGNTNCEFIEAGGTFVNYAADADCSSPVVTGEVDVQSSPKVPGFKISNAEPGVYYVVASGVFLNNGSDPSVASFRLSDGTNVSAVLHAHSSGLDFNHNLTGSFNHSGGDLVIDVQGRDFGDGGAIAQISVTNDDRELGFEVYRFPSASKEAITLETTGAHLDALHANDCTFAVSSSSYSDPGSDSSCTFSVDRNVGFKNVQTDTSGGDAVPSILFDPPYAGVFYVCASLVMNTTDHSVAARLIHNGQVIAEDSDRERTTSAESLRMCGFFDVSSVTQQEISLEAKQNSTTIFISPLSKEKYTVHWTMFPIGQGLPAPLLTEIQSHVQSTVDGTRLESCIIDNPGTPVTNSNLCDNWVDSLTDSAVGTTVVNFTSGTFSSIPGCTCSSFENELLCTFTGVSQTSATVIMNDSGGNNTDADFTIQCHGKK